MSDSTIHAGRRSRLKALAGTVMLACALMSPATGVADTSTPTRQAAPLAYTWVVASTTIVSTTGKRLKVSVSGSRESGEGARMSVTVANIAGTESHDFSFPKASLSVSSTGSGTGALSGTQSGGRAKIQLKFSPDGAMTSRKCQGQVYGKSRPLKVGGVMWFSIGSTWGRVGSKTRPMKFGAQSAVNWSYDVGCPPTGEQDPCRASLNWSVSTPYSSSGFSTIFGFKASSKVSVTGSRQVRLSKPAGATRFDYANRTGVKAPAMSTSGSTTTLAVFAPGGKGRIVSRTEGWNPGPQTCRGGTQNTTNWSGTFVQGSPTVKVPASAFGAITVPNGESGYFSRTVVN